jgi:HmuY protein
MKSIFFKSILMTAASAMMLVACDKEDNGAPVDTSVEKRVNDLSADTILGIAASGQPYGSGKYTLYSLENGTVVSNTDSATSKWDLGFRGTSIITNSGTGGPGSGGAFVQIGTFESLTTISPDSTFRVDAAPSAYAIPLGSNKGWYVYDGPTNLINPIPGRVLVVRTANGKYAKVEIINYYKGGVTPAASASDDVKLKTQRYFTFRYTFQSNGSRDFQ